MVAWWSIYPADYTPFIDATRSLAYNGSALGIIWGSAGIGRQA